LKTNLNRLDLKTITLNYATRNFTQVATRSALKYTSIGTLSLGLNRWLINSDAMLIEILKVLNSETKKHVNLAHPVVNLQLVTQFAHKRYKKDHKQLADKTN
jgi:hypothetical protein